MTMDLIWTTAGTPYQYRITTRYEIPCTVSGTVTADGREFVIKDVPGQRDHSWGVRDWWSMDWVWSALHLDDGSHIHGVDIRIPGAPPIGIGYLQEPGRPLIEPQTVTARQRRRILARQGVFRHDRGPDHQVVVDHGDGTVGRRPGVGAVAWVRHMTNRPVSP